MFAGEPIVEPEVDLSAFLEKQRLADDESGPSAPPPPEEEDDVDHNYDHLFQGGSAPTMKGKVEQIQWDNSLDALLKDKIAADASRGTFSVAFSRCFMLMLSNRSERTLQSQS
jgi:hypothetical protein